MFRLFPPFIQDVSHHYKEIVLWTFLFTFPHMHEQEFLWSGKSVSEMLKHSVCPSLTLLNTAKLFSRDCIKTLPTSRLFHSLLHIWYFLSKNVLQPKVWNSISIVFAIFRATFHIYWSVLFLKVIVHDYCLFFYWVLCFFMWRTFPPVILKLIM